MEPVREDVASSQACENGTPKTPDTTTIDNEHNEIIRLIEAERERNKSILRRLTKTSLLELCEENSVGEFHLFEECQEEHCLIAKQVFRLMTDLVQKCSEIDPRFESKLLWTGSSAEGTKMWLPDEFDFLMELVGLRGNCEYDNSFLFLSKLFVKKECQELWSNLCCHKDSLALSPLKLKDHFTILVQKAASLLDKSKYQNIRFEDKSYMRNGIKVTKVGINITIYWLGEKYKHMKIEIDLTVGVPLVLNEIQLSRYHKHSVGKLLDNRIHVVPHTRHNGMWRPSFSLSEFQMLKNLTRKQVALYKCLKFCRDINTLIPTFNGETIPSYYLKMFLFNYLYLEKNGSNAKTISECLDFYSSFYDVLHRLIQSASPSPLRHEAAIIPHFFAMYNLLLGRFDMRWCKLTLAALESS
jgi:hypothetical protein